MYNTFEWIQSLRNWGKVYDEFTIMYEGQSHFKGSFFNKCGRKHI